jgi:tetrahydromethanopterin S-methyltransferase subunit E
MRVIIGFIFIAVMGCVFTLITTAVFVTQHLFASTILAGVLAAVVGATARRRRARRTPRRRYYQPMPLCSPLSMSSAALPRRRLPSLPTGGARHG